MKGIITIAIMLAQPSIIPTVSVPFVRGEYNSLAHVIGNRVR
jgi:hypothetical protein